MKFVSKVNNFRVVLRPGLEGSRVTGTAPTPGLYIKFEDGIAIVNDPKSIKLLREHPDFGNDFHEIDETEIDPYLKNRSNTEPEHDVIEMKYGSPGKNFNPKPKFSISSEMKEYIEQLVEQKANERVGVILDEMVKKGEDKIGAGKKTTVKKSVSKIKPKVEEVSETETN